MEGEVQLIARDRQGLEVLDLETCLTLAGTVPIGRIAFQRDGRVIVLPVNHVLDVEGVAFRVAEGSSLDAALMERTMSFQVDQHDDDAHTGWSVLVTGRAAYVDDEETIARLDERELVPWSAPDLRTNWVILRPDQVSGRRID